jgi:hypothetical protein
MNLAASLIVRMSPASTPERTASGWSRAVEFVSTVTSCRLLCWLRLAAIRRTVGAAPAGLCALPLPHTVRFPAVYLLCDSGVAARAAGLGNCNGQHRIAKSAARRPRSAELAQQERGAQSDAKPDQPIPTPIAKRRNSGWVPAG